MTTRNVSTPHPLSNRERDFVRQRRFGTLVTTNASGRPSTVPCVYAIVDEASGPAVVMALDEKSKSVGVRELARVRNILARPEATLLVSDDREDWDRLAYVSLRGHAALIEPGEPGHDEAIGALRAKYPQYASHRLEGLPQIRMTDLHPTSWQADANDHSESDAPIARPVELTAIIQGRRSVRAFRADPVPRGSIERAIGAAAWAPSPHGTQPWRFIVLESREPRTRLADAMAETWREQLALDGQDAATVERRVANSRDRLITPPVVLLLCRYLADLDAYPDPRRQAAEYTMATQSLGAAAQNLLLSLYADGLDAGWMCAPLFCPALIVETLGLDNSLEPQALFPVGYPAKDPVRRPRRSVSELIVRWE